MKLLNSYKNPFYNKNYQGSEPVIKTDSLPIKHKEFLIYHRIKSTTPGCNVFDIVKDGICYSMYAGLNGAKKAIDEKKIISPFFKKGK